MRISARFLRRAELLRLLLPTKAGTMKRIWVISFVVVLTIVMSSNLAAQQTSSALQVVTFGVSRTSHMVAGSLNSATLSKAASLPSESWTLAQTLATIPAKITVSSKIKPSAVSSPASLSTEKSASATDLTSESAKPENYEGVDTDLRTYLQGEATSLINTSSLVLTITD